MQLLRDAMLEHADSPGFLIDGFPRELGQAKQFENEVTLNRTVTPVFLRWSRAYFQLIRHVLEAN